MNCIRQGGIALVMVLWLVSLLTLLATAIVSISVTHRRIAERDIDSVQADALSDSAIRLVLLHFIEPSGQVTAPQMGMQMVTVFGSSVEVTVERELGRVDLNTGDPDLLFALFAANGWSERDAHSMVARILDWRDADDQPNEEGGAESHEYRAAGLSYGPRNANFESVDELHQLLGSDQISAELFSAFTVYTHSRGVLESEARPAVRRALEWAEQQQLGGRHWARQRGGITDISDSAAFTYGKLSGEVIRLRACAALRQGTTAHCRRIVVRLTGNSVRPLQIFEWREA